ncbi:DAK2 domain-containing protein [Corynebacterium lizhenjunii]|uniref:DAK2 domain-containing protein n=1 Tax=Corynebacterium lizhenjunii TaxID=2709394 RepID=UPI0013EDD0E4|nr:DAK2 domain-containing protein [Corynebacterium lizhenjunii]
MTSANPSAPGPARAYPRELSAQGLHNWALRCVRELSARRAEINALNVFPVPDADTGSNMAHTMEAALAQADKGGDVAEALAVGSVRGARGNSGMVLSQVLRGVADSTTDSRVDAAVLADSLSLAVDLVDRALAQPVEGTIITVLRAAAAEAANSRDQELYPMTQRVVAAARQALADTPSQLAVLREAGVVDAGGAGLVVVLESLQAELEGAQMAAEPVAAEDSRPEFEVMFFFEGDLEVLEQQLTDLGNSLVLAREHSGAAAVHIHSARAGEVIEAAFAAGAVSQLRIEVLPPVCAASSAAPSELADAPAPSAVPEAADAAGVAAPEAASSPRRRVWVAAPEGPVTQLFAQVGAEVVEPGVAPTQAQPGDIFLPNGTDTPAGQATVVPTQSIVAGVAALSVYDPQAEDAAAAMADAAASMRVRQLGLSGATAQELLGQVLDVVRELLAAGGEQVTVLSPRELDQDYLAHELGVEVMVIVAPGVGVEVGVE